MIKHPPASSTRISQSFERSNGRAAFTLLELMLALGLTGTLLTVVYSSLELHWRFSTLGQVEVERAQIARAILTKISTTTKIDVLR